MWYLGLLAPSAPIDWGSGTLLVAAGPTLLMPTATEDVVGLGKWSGGAGGLLGWTSRAARHGRRSLAVSPKDFRSS